MTRFFLSPKFYLIGMVGMLLAGLIFVGPSLGQLATTAQNYHSDQAIAADDNYPGVKPEDVQRVKKGAATVAALLTAEMNPGCKDNQRFREWLFNRLMDHLTWKKNFPTKMIDYRKIGFLDQESLAEQGCFKHSDDDSLAALIQRIDGYTIGVFSKSGMSLVQLEKIVGSIVDAIIGTMS